VKRREIIGHPHQGRFSVQAAVRFDAEEFLKMLNSGNEKSRISESSEMACAQLRVYVEELLSTAISGGVEAPGARHLRDAPGAYLALLRFIRENPPQLVVLDDNVSVDFRDGRMSIGELMASFGHMRHFNKTPKQMAELYFGLLVLAGWHRKLAKCRRLGCDRYFWLKHWNRLYKRGTACPACMRARSLEGAKATTAAARNEAASVLYQRAAERFSRQLAKTRDWHESAELKSKIVEHLNARIGRDTTLKSVYPRGITSKWLGWRKNQLGIENARKEGANAKR